MAKTQRVSDDAKSVNTLNAKERIRGQLNMDIEAFLSKGGAITEVELNVSADPPIKPASKYGGRSI
ncbi:MAG: hypothetical protein ACJAXW_004311 [Candidatus Azotimanducaceae bacterium]|jgi:hypothetical protein